MNADEESRMVTRLAQVSYAAGLALGGLKGLSAAGDTVDPGKLKALIERVEVALHQPLYAQPPVIMPVEGVPRVK